MDLTRDKFTELMNMYFAAGRKDWRAIALDGGKGDASFSTTLERWSGVTIEDLDTEDGLA